MSTSGLEDKFQNLHEIVKAAQANLPPGPWDYLVGGTETETTLRRNRLAIDTIAFRPRVLRNVSTVDLTTTFLGRKVRLPVLTAPIGGLESFEAGGGAPPVPGHRRAEPPYGCSRVPDHAPPLNPSSIGVSARIHRARSCTRAGWPTHSSTRSAHTR